MKYYDAFVGKKKKRRKKANILERIRHKKKTAKNLI